MKLKKLIAGLLLGTSLLVFTACEEESSPTTVRPTGNFTSISTTTQTSVPTSIQSSNPVTTITSVPTSTPTSVPTSVPTSAPTSTPTSIPTTTPTTPPVVTSMYEKLKSHPGNIIAEDFNNYSSTDSLTTWPQTWETRGIYQHLNEKTAGTADQSQNYVKLGAGNAQMVDTSNNGTQIIVNFGSNLSTGTIYGYLELTLSSVGNSWTLFQLHGTSSTQTSTAELFGIRTDGGYFKYRLGSSGTVTQAKTNVATGNSKFEIYFVADLENDKLTLTLNGSEFVTDLSLNINTLDGIKLVSSDNGSKLISLDNLAIVHEDYTLDEYKIVMSNKLTEKFNTYPIEKHPNIISDMQTAHQNGLDAIARMYTKAEVDTQYNNFISVFEGIICAEAKIEYIANLDTYVDKNNYQINKEALENAKTQGSININNASTYEEVNLAYANALKLIDVVEDDTKAILTYKANAKLELSSYLDKELYKENQSVIDKKLNDFNPLIDNCNSISEIDLVVINAKKELDTVLSDAQILENTKTEAIAEIESARNNFVSKLNENDHSSFILSINNEANKGIANLASLTTKQAVIDSKNNTITNMELYYESATKSLEIIKENAIKDLENYANSKIELYPDETENINTIAQNAIVEINGALTNQEVINLLDEAKAAIDKYIDENVVKDPSVGGNYPQTTIADIWVSPDGSDEAQGTQSAPYKSLYKAISVVTPGRNIIMKKGTYPMSERLNLTASGTEETPIYIQAENWEEVVLDYSTQPYGFNDSKYVGIYLKGNYWRLQGLTICHAGDNGIKIEGSYNYIGRCVLHHNGDSGIQLGFGHDFSATGFGSSNDGSYCSYNTIENCDSYLNYDFDNWGDADGYACKMHNGKGNMFIGCRAWNNVDDAWDLYETDYTVTLIDCWAWNSAKLDDYKYDEYFSNPDYLAQKSTIKTIKVPSGVGNGNGIKFGGNGAGGNSKGIHYATNCVSFNNDKTSSTKGFDENNHTEGVVLKNCVGWDNGYNYMFPKGGANNSFTDCISFYTDTRGTSYNKPNRLAGETGVGASLLNNSFIYDGGDLVHKTMFTADDFITLSVEAASAPRQADGSLPNNGFARLKPTSPYYGLGMGLV